MDRPLARMTRRAVSRATTHGCLRSYISARLQAIPLLLVISIALFGLLHLIPGGPGAGGLQPAPVRAARHNMVVALGLDQPLPLQYVQVAVGRAAPRLRRDLTEASR